jgi:hypothetical protein
MVMSRMSRIGRILVLVVVGGALLPASSALAGGPVAKESGVLINYVSTGKLKIGKSIEITAVCSANCTVQSHSVTIGPGYKQKSNISGPLTAGVPGGPVFQPNGPLLKLMKASPGRFKIQNTLVATDDATGATDEISHTFKLKR